MNTTFTSSRPPPDYQETTTPDHEEPNRSPTYEHTRKRVVKDQLINWLAARSLLSILVILAAPSLAILLASTVFQYDPSSDPSSTRCSIFMPKELRRNLLSRLVNTLPFVSTDTEFAEIEKLAKEGYDACIELNERAAVKFSTTSAGRYQASNCGSSPAETLHLAAANKAANEAAKSDGKFMHCYLNPAQYYCSSTLATRRQRTECRLYIKRAFLQTRYNEMDAKDHLLRFAIFQAWQHQVCYESAAHGISDSLVDVEGNKVDVEAHKDFDWFSNEDEEDEIAYFISNADADRLLRTLNSCDDLQLELNETALEIMRQKS